MISCNTCISSGDHGWIRDNLSTPWLQPAAIRVHPSSRTSPWPVGTRLVSGTRSGTILPGPENKQSKFLIFFYLTYCMFPVTEMSLKRQSRPTQGQLVSGGGGLFCISMGTTKEIVSATKNNWGTMVETFDWLKKSCPGNRLLIFSLGCSDLYALYHSTLLNELKYIINRTNKPLR